MYSTNTDSDTNISRIISLILFHSAVEQCMLINSAGLNNQCF